MWSVFQKGFSCSAKIGEGGWGEGRRWRGGLGRLGSPRSVKIGDGGVVGVDWD